MQKDVTTVEALRSYENDLTAQGFTTLWKGKGEELDNGFGRFITEVYQHSKVNSMMEYIFPGASDYRYLAMHRKGDDGSEQFMAGFFAIVSSGWGSKYAAEGDCLARIDLLEVKAIENRMVTVKAEEMGEQLKSGGRVALYGILFDSNRAEVKPESSETLAEVSKYLQSDPTAKILVVGHTDSVGGFESNRDLSERRARAVVEYLVSKHQITRERLFSFGVSYASPVASNEAEAGRAKNRRVELVRY
jgi:outer membrane protein OmpA-like peptidoglycan-associated protein